MYKHMKNTHYCAVKTWLACSAYYVCVFCVCVCVCVCAHACVYGCFGSFAASLTDASVTQRLHADVLATQKMDQNMIGSLTDDDMPSEVESVSSYSQSDACPPHIQVCFTVIFIQEWFLFSKDQIWACVSLGDA